MRKFLLIDGNNLLCRAHYATKLTNSRGEAVSGTFGVMKMLSQLVREFKADSVIMAWDGKSEKRFELYPEYKAQRKSDPKVKEDLSRQRKHCQTIIKFLPVKQIRLETVEADDIIGYLSKVLKGDKIIISSDQDFLQAIDETTKVFLPSKNMILRADNVSDFLGFPVEHYPFWKSVVGDTSDNIKGIHGIGPVKATKLIESGINSVETLKDKAEKEIVARNMKLIKFGAILTDAEFQGIRDEFKREHRKEININLVARIFKKLEFMSLSGHFDQWSEPFKKLI